MMSAVVLLDEMIQIFEAADKRTFIFGYGSLINKKSRNGSYKTDAAYPVRVHHYKRIWNRSEGPNEPWMGIISLQNHTVNGVLFEVNEAMLKAFDERELKWGYHRRQVPLSSIEMLDNYNALSPDDIRDKVETYELTKLREQECDKLGIDSIKYKRLRANPQCYIDIVLKGCMEYGESFLIEFIKTMHDWRYEWKLDRSEGKTVGQSWELSNTECIYFDKMLAKYIKKHHHFIPFHLATSMQPNQ